MIPLVSSLSPLIAQAAPGNPLFQVVFLVGIFVLMYFLLIRPQSKQVKEHRSMLGSLKKDDVVVIQGGIIGTIHSVSDREIVMEIANGVKVRVVKQSIQGRWAATQTEPVAKKESK